ncbi:1-(5-phosphoribosyl)-5-[(5-phosphoribosylamino)methylideneamino] imidazole-4-carboxamide isomerase, chloroplastic isoform X2 [Argentina anserina]|uniref:1-(5-phosphoribosyl)-5-[(5- phosphoribosylamino)methylideneamino] imidazole-4-carboxamide isomerase, chloroplastic isoform X2 n=1 Tax=Argentina anserina TaxID=57926 RepID=UPI0021764738|nr:1-(5-phosphoribosyl)-5-[(5-phosphoribosylamino)methylideneamino] imidazole-4-carboxamide isomerase, chloroplastic isoform X2 [Potentilla anserina]
MRVVSLSPTVFQSSYLLFGAKKLYGSRPSATFRIRRVPISCAVRFRPCIDIHKGKVKQIVGSTLSDLKEDGTALVTNFESDKSAGEFARMYKEDGLTGGHVIMLGADPLSRAAAIEALRAYPGGLQVGGGINSDNSLQYIEEGASHVIVTSYVFNNGQMDLERLKDLVHVVGKERLVLDLSCRKREGKYAIVTDRWQKFSDVYLDKDILDFLANYADEFLVHGVDVEGKKLGIDEELVELLGKNSPVRKKKLSSNICIPSWYRMLIKIGEMPGLCKTL